MRFHYCYAQDFHYTRPRWYSFIGENGETYYWLRLMGWMFGMSVNR